MTNFSDLVKGYKAIFWDFDGVIKESLSVKGDSFLSLFENLNSTQKQYISHHHYSNGGVNRYKKISHYLEYLNLPCDPLTVNLYAEKFSSTVVEKVLLSDWVPGAYEFLKSNTFDQLFFLTSATPDDELSYILPKLNINGFFTSFSGSSTPKSSFIPKMIKEYDLFLTSCIMVGDSLADLNAAVDAKISFVFRRSKNSTVDYSSQNYPVLDHFLS